MMKTPITLAVLALLAGTAQAATPTTWTNTVTVAGATTTISFNDWGYTGPTGVGANDYQVGGGFDASRIGQVQHVVTSNPDWNTPDPAYPTVYADLYEDQSFTNANMDAGVNFYAWGYTTVGGSTFNNMQIDKAGNYHIARNDMAFQYYDTFAYRDKTGANPDTTFDTNINFQPYAISDATGWCGSVLSSDPNNLEKMAGQVTFDFAFDAYLNDEAAPGHTGGGYAIQIVPDFVMRSYGSYHVHYEEPGRTLDYYGSAVINNTNPLTGEVDPAFQNKVSFLGAGVVPLGVWINIHSIQNVDGVDYMDYSVADVQGANGETDGEVRGDGAVWHANAFAGYAFLMRADGTRTLDWINPAGFSDYQAASVPVPAAAWLLGSGLLGLAGVARRRLA